MSWTHSFCLSLCRLAAPHRAQSSRVHHGNHHQVSFSVLPLLVCTPMKPPIPTPPTNSVVLLLVPAALPADARLEVGACHQKDVWRWKEASGQPAEIIWSVCVGGQPGPPLVRVRVRTFLRDVVEAEPVEAGLHLLFWSIILCSGSEIARGVTTRRFPLNPLNQMEHPTEGSRHTNTADGPGSPTCGCGRRR